MKIIPKTINDVLLIVPDVFSDDRGHFIEVYNAQKFADAGFDVTFVQDNQSRSRQGVLRGLHYQYRQAQGKLVRVVLGDIFDVAVDIRRSSPTFGRWVGARLSAENKQQLWVPPGFAHGFYALSEWAEVVYKATDFYRPEFEAILSWNDPDLGIDWPLIDHQMPSMSEKDRTGKQLRDATLFE